MAHDTQIVKKKARSVSLDNSKCPRNLAKNKKVPKALTKTRVKKRKRGPKTPEEISRLKKEVISKVRGGCSYTKAAEQLGIERNTIKNWQDADSVFKSACEYAREMSVERVEDAMHEAALKVNENPRYTTAAIFFLKNRCPGRWRDVKDVRQTDSYAEMVDKMDPAQLLRLIKANAMDLDKYTPQDLLPVIQEVPEEAEHETTYRPREDR